MVKKILITIFFITTGILISAWIWTEQKAFKENPEQAHDIKIFITGQSIIGYPFFIAFEKGYFKNHGMNIKLIPCLHGKAALDAVAKGEADFGLSSETPFMNAVLKGDKLYAIAITLTAHDHLGLVARKDRGISTERDLIGKNIGVTVGSNGEYFLDMVLSLYGILAKQVNIIDIKPQFMVEALLDGKIDAISTWNPHKDKAYKNLGENAIVFNAKGLYSPFFIVSARQSYVNDNPAIIKKMLRALDDASKYIRLHPLESRKIASKYIKPDVFILDDLSSNCHFNITLDQALITTLEDQAQWSIKNSLSPNKEIPNFLNFIYTDALESVAPENMTIIK